MGALRTSAELDTAELRKARGAFFTPEPVARYITDWAMRSASDHVLEPSCGEAAFLMAAVDRLGQLIEGAPPEEGGGPVGALDGVELHAASASAAQHLLDQAGVKANIQVADFFTITPSGTYDAVIGNPPYIRYQDFGGEARARSRKAALRAGVVLTGLASSWAAFTIHAALFLKPGGRLGLVLPAELLSVNYAGQIRAFLLAHFRTVDLVLFEERVFPGVLEEVVLLLADGYREGPTDHASVYEARNAADLATVAAGRKWRPTRPQDKWTPSLLSKGALQTYSTLLDGQAFTELETWGDTTLGMVTGNNKFFALSPARADELGLDASALLPLSPPGSRHLRGLAFTSEDWTELGREGRPTHLFRPTGEPTSAVADYVAAGQTAGVNLAYKCRVRHPWWRVPLVPPADLLLTYMNADTPRLITNLARVHHLNSVHGVYLRPQLKDLGSALLPLGSLNSMTLVGAETVGRAYGGGMLKLEPREADRLPVPAPSLLDAVAPRLDRVRDRALAALRASRLDEAARLVDTVLFVEELGMQQAEVDDLHRQHVLLRARRTTRGAAAQRA